MLSSKAPRGADRKCVINWSFNGYYFVFRNAVVLRLCTWYRRRVFLVTYFLLCCCTLCE